MKVKKQIDRGDQWERAFGMLRKKKPTEFNVHKNVCSYLRNHYPGIRFYSTLDGFDWGNQRLVMSSLRWYDEDHDGTGVPDLFIFKSNSKYSMLIIELKKDDVKTSGGSKHIEAQRAWLEYLAYNCNAVALFASGFEQAKSIIDEYFGKQNTVHNKTVSKKLPRVKSARSKKKR